MANGLAVHGDPGTREQIANALSAEGLRQVAVASWPEARAALRAITVRVVVVATNALADPVPPDGQEAWQTLTSAVPFIVLTPTGDVRGTRAALRAGAWDCLEEPLDRRALRQSIREALAAGTGPTAPRDACGPRGQGLAGLARYSDLLQQLAAWRSRCHLLGQTLAVMMLDLNHFRECNERYSSAFGDEVLNWFAAILLATSRSSDLVARYEADRFLVVLPCAREQDAREWGQRCRAAMQRNFPVRDGTPFEIGVSLAIVESSRGFVETEHQLIRRARVTLDCVKRAGGNRMGSWSQLVAGMPSSTDLRQARLEGVPHWVDRIGEQLRCTYLESTQALVAAVEAKDPYTRMHSQNVAAYAETLGRRLGLPAARVESLRVAGFLHDLGKIGVPDAVLTKPGLLTPPERQLIQRHPRTALDILGHLRFLNDELPLIHHHHERYDGGGYPDGLAREEIPFGARVLATADALDAMLSGRCYKPPYPKERVQAELEAGAGTQFDPTVVAAALSWLDEQPPSAPAAS